MTRDIQNKKMLREIQLYRKQMWYDEIREDRDIKMVKAMDINKPPKNLTICEEIFCSLRNF